MGTIRLSEESLRKLRGYIYLLAQGGRKEVGRGVPPGGILTAEVGSSSLTAEVGSSSDPSRLSGSRVLEEAVGKELVISGIRPEPLIDVEKEEALSSFGPLDGDEVGADVAGEETRAAEDRYGTEVTEGHEGKEAVEEA